MIGRLHVITDQVLQDRFDHVALARLAVQGGADVIQYREKRPVHDRERLRVAEALARLCESNGVQLIIDDRPDVAALVGAGCHVGPNDLPVAGVRSVVDGPVGSTANSLAMAEDPHVASANYLGCGPVFGTTSKGADPPPTLGLARLRIICEQVAMPVIAIGGIGVDEVSAVIAAGAHGIAVLGAVCLAPDPTAATLALRNAVDAAVNEARDRG